MYTGARRRELCTSEAMFAGKLNTEEKERALPLRSAKGGVKVRKTRRTKLESLGYLNDR